MLSGSMLVKPTRSSILCDKLLWGFTCKNIFSPISKDRFIKHTPLFSESARRATLLSSSKAIPWVYLWWNLTSSCFCSLNLLISFPTRTFPETINYLFKTNVLLSKCFGWLEFNILFTCKNKGFDVKHKFLRQYGCGASCVNFKTHFFD